MSFLQRFSSFLLVLCILATVRAPWSVLSDTTTTGLVMVAPVGVRADAPPAPAPQSDSTAASITDGASITEPTGIPQPGSAGYGTGDGYEGWEWKKGSVLLRPALFKTEAYAFLGIIAYILLTRYGGSLNASKATKLMSSGVGSTLQDEFANVGATESSLIVKAKPNLFYCWASGRRGMDGKGGGVCIEVKTARRDDPVQYLYEQIRPLFDFDFIPDSDRVTFTFNVKPTSEEQGAVWALVKKNAMVRTRKQRYDIRAFAYRESELPSILPSDLIVFSELGEITDSLLKLPKAQKVGFLELLEVWKKAGKEGLPGLEWFESLIVTDVGAEEPRGLRATLPTDLRQIVLTFQLPSPTSRSSDLIPFIQLACNLVDVLNLGIRLTPEGTGKLRRHRREVNDKLMEEARKFEKEEMEEKMRAAKKKAEEDRIAKMSPAELRRKEEADRKKQKRKQDSKMIKRR